MASGTPKLMSRQAAAIGAAEVIGNAAIRRMEQMVERRISLPQLAVISLGARDGPPRAVVVSIPGC